MQSYQKVEALENGVAFIIKTSLQKAQLLMQWGCD